MDLDQLARLHTAEGAAALAAAHELAGSEPLAAAATLRRAGFAADLAAAALTQAGLRRAARAKFGPDADRLWFTRAGLEQATRSVVARRRAQRLAEAGVAHVADLGCGLGADAIAFARAGLRVSAVEVDPLTAACAAANAAALGLTERLRVDRADATAADLSTVDGIFCDPARRGRPGQRVFDPRAFSPPWSFVAQLPRRVPATVLKLAPGFDHALIPTGAEAEWVSVDGTVVEAALWCGPLATVPRRASVRRGELEADELTGSGDAAAPVGPVRAHVYDPDGAVVRAHLVAEFAATIGGTLADPRIAYVFTDAAQPTPFGRGFEVLERLPYGLKRLRAAVRSRGIGTLEIKKRGLDVDPDRLRRELRLDGSQSATLILTRVADAPTALLARAHR
ncbi:MAG: THUMP-like domain-containing protein [Micromonosporaceae bacterium]